MESLQPRSLRLLFFSESIQRLGSYGIQSILLLFLLKAFGYSPNLAYITYGVFTALSFILAILGGLLADRWLGFRKVVLLGITISLLGNMILAVNIPKFTVLGLGCILCGFGLFLPNNSSLLGSFYEDSDPHRVRGFTIFYIGTNIGGLLGPIIYGILSNYGWHYPFIISSMFLFAWIALYLKFQNYFKDHGSSPRLVSGHNGLYNLLAYPLLTLLLLSVVFLLKHPTLGGQVITIIGIFSVLLVTFDGLRRNSQERKRVFLLVCMIMCALVFFASVFQIYTSLLIFIEQYVDRAIFDWLVPSSAFASLEPLFIIILAPVLVRLWKTLNVKNGEPSPITKMALGLLLGGCGFGIFALGAYFAIEMHHIAVTWIIVGNLLLALGELCIMPTLIAAITQYAPKNIKSTMMGLLYLSLAFSSYVSSLIGKLTIQNGQYSKPSIYYSVYSKIFFLTICLVMLLLTVVWVIRWYRGRLFAEKEPAKI